ncbi:50S ribosomal protein L21 [endosymbiont of Euscepes postfasciatus]|uniref:50S ribosomal protein L21 n=1 Tax=endosymbiont of Euscepes postfasciatus TaxID=650377 RepID=UPI000DC73C05|nr:50S ribosomal protein L21 [endosymbiont of Euscepes postfasciatus]BBA84580.1 50S ribosomal protein L21 [endosymbiont of Euscepes postfasciatus]
MYVVVDIFSKQFLLEENNIICLNRLNYPINSKIEINKILLINDNNNLIIGDPYIKNRKVIILILNHFRSEKIKIIKFKRRKHQLKKFNFRNIFTKIKILNII